MTAIQNRQEVRNISALSSNRSRHLPSHIYEYRSNERKHLQTNHARQPDTKRSRPFIGTRSCYQQVDHHRTPKRQHQYRNNEHFSGEKTILFKSRSTHLQPLTLLLIGLPTSFSGKLPDSLSGVQFHVTPSPSYSVLLTLLRQPSRK